jgi:predicted DsbA family dithiol-disulfide isomerase
MVDLLFKAYFEEGADIGSVSTLVQLAARAGLETEAFLGSDEGTTEVKAEESEGHRLGIRGVPYFVLDQQFGISGAHPVDVFVSAIHKARAQQSMPLESKG